MNKFIEVHDTIINVDDIRRVEFLSDDIYLKMENSYVILFVLILLKFIPLTEKQYYYLLIYIH